MNRFKNSMIARHRRWMALSALLIAVATLSVGTKLMKAQETGPPAVQPARVYNFGLVGVAHDQSVRLSALKLLSHGEVTVNLKIRRLRRIGVGGALQIDMLAEKQYLQEKDTYFTNGVSFVPDHGDRYRFVPDYGVNTPPDTVTLNVRSIEVFATVTITGGDSVDRASVIPTLEVVDIESGKTAIVYPVPPPCGATGEPCNDGNDVNH